MAENPARTGNAASSYLPPRSPSENEGHTFAAWFAMIGVMVGTVVVGVGMVVVSVPLLVIGAVVIVAGLVGGAVLRKAGRGQPQH